MYARFLWEFIGVIWFSTLWFCNKFINKYCWKRFWI